MVIPRNPCFANDCVKIAAFPCLAVASYWLDFYWIWNKNKAAIKSIVSYSGVPKILPFFLPPSLSFSPPFTPTPEEGEEEQGKCEEEEEEEHHNRYRITRQCPAMET